MAAADAFWRSDGEYRRMAAACSAVCVAARLRAGGVLIDDGALAQRPGPSQP